MLENFLLRRPDKSTGGGAITLVVRPASSTVLYWYDVFRSSIDGGCRRAREPIGRDICSNKLIFLPMHWYSVRHAGVKFGPTRPRPFPQPSRPKKSVGSLTSRRARAGPAPRPPARPPSPPFRPPVAPGSRPSAASDLVQRAEQDRRRRGGEGAVPRGVEFDQRRRPVRAREHVQILVDQQQERQRELLPQRYH